MIEPIYENQWVKLYQGDCLQVMPQLNMTFDACITDLPFGTSGCKWDMVIPFEDMWRELKRLIKPNGAICLFGIEPFSSYLRISNIQQWKYDWIWDKGAFANFLNVHYQPGKKHEIISVFSSGASSYSKNENMVYYPQYEPGKAYTQLKGEQKFETGNASVRSKIQRVITENQGIRYPASIIKFNKDRDTEHPTQKPTALLEYLIKTYTLQNEIVLDFTSGSGTAGVAAMETNRRVVLIEKEEKYCEITIKRLQDKEKQIAERLF